MLKSRVFLIAIITLVASITCTHVYPCDVVVVSARASTTGRPFIWKSRDCSANWHQEIKYYPALTTKAGPYIMVNSFDDAAQFNNGTPDNPSGGVNQAGFGISCTSVYEDFNPFHEIININTDLIRHALQECATLADWENLLKNFHKSHWGKVISGNFVVIDANGGAALYECYTGLVFAGFHPMNFRKFDANNGKVTAFNGTLSFTTTEDPGTGTNFIGFFARANSNSYITFNYGEERRWRMEELLEDLAASGRLNYRNNMVEVIKDVNGKQVDAYGNQLDPSKFLDNYSTTYCISRAATRLSMLVDGVAPGGNPLQSVFWCALGEPSASVFLPYFVYAGGVSPLAYVDDIDIDGTQYDLNDNSLLARAANARETFEGLLYETNTGDLVMGMEDKTMNKYELSKIQSWSFHIEEYIFQKTEEFMADMTEHPSYITPENLRSFSDYCVHYAYSNYLEGSADTYAWNFDKPWSPMWEGYTRGGFDPISPVGTLISSNSSSSLLDSFLGLFGF